MCSVKTSDTEAAIRQISRLEKAGCEIIRVSVLDEVDALSIKKIKDKINIPLVADIHFSDRLAVAAIESGCDSRNFFYGIVRNRHPQRIAYTVNKQSAERRGRFDHRHFLSTHFSDRLAVAAIESGCDKVRINPGNIGGEKEIKYVADCIKTHGIPVRVGANTGSIEKEFLEKYGINENALVESALSNVRILEKYGVEDIVISVKASDVPLTVKAYRALSERTEYPLHIGVTEAGTEEMARTVYDAPHNRYFQRL